MSREIMLAALVLLAPLSAMAEDSSYPPWPWQYQFVAFSVPGLDNPVAARLSFPSQGEPPFPAVIIAHGSGGVDSRGPLYARRLNEAGMATLEIDMWAARGMSGGLDRPDHVRQTLPDAYAARAYLANREEIQGENIGLMGFSWGGVMAMLAAGGAGAQADETATLDPFAALVALYPVCWGYNRVAGYELDQLQAEDLLVIAGDRDDYDGSGDCQDLLSSLSEEDRKKAELITLREATHAFDRRAAEALFHDPFAYQGKGGEVHIRYNPAATKHALSKVTEFFRMTLGTGESRPSVSAEEQAKNNEPAPVMSY